MIEKIISVIIIAIIFIISSEFVMWFIGFKHTVIILLAIIAVFALDSGR